MYYPAFYFHSNCFFIRETAAVSYRRNGALADWPEDELARVRVVLQKLTCLRVNNPEDAEDLVQETLLTMAVRCPDVSIEKGLLIWGMGILRNKVGNYYRRTRRCGPVTGHKLAYETCRSGTPLFPSPESRLHYAELCALVDRILKDFSPGERRPVQMLLAGLPTSEIAARLQPELYQNVVNRLHRGRKKLALQMTKFGYGEGLTSQKRR